MTTALRESYDFRHHRRDAPQDNPNSAAIDKDFADSFGVGGPPTYVIDRLAEVVDLGVDFIAVALPEAEQELFAENVIPALRDMRPHRA